MQATTLADTAALWQGLGIRAVRPPGDELVRDTANLVWSEICRLGGSVPVNVLVAWLDREYSGRDAHDRVLDALADAPEHFELFGL